MHNSVDLSSLVVLVSLRFANSRSFAVYENSFLRRKSP